MYILRTMLKHVHTLYIHVTYMNIQIWTSIYMYIQCMYVSWSMYVPDHQRIGHAYPHHKSGWPYQQHGQYRHGGAWACVPFATCPSEQEWHSCAHWASCPAPSRREPCQTQLSWDYEQWCKWAWQVSCAWQNFRQCTKRLPKELSHPQLCQQTVIKNVYMY